MNSWKDRERDKYGIMFNDTKKCVHSFTDRQLMSEKRVQNGVGRDKTRTQKIGKQVICVIIRVKRRAEKSKSVKKQKL